MDITWIVSADSGRARIFADAGQNQPLEEVEDMVNSAARLRTADMVTDQLDPKAAGKSIHSTGGALPTSQYEPDQSPEDRAAAAFAKDICGYLLKCQRDGKFDKLALVAAPGFLGDLRQCLDPQLKPLISYEINKDYSHSSGQQLREQIRAHQAKS